MNNALMQLLSLIKFNFAMIYLMQIKFLLILKWYTFQNHFNFLKNDESVVNNSISIEVNNI